MIETIELKNGTKLILEEMDSVGSVSVGIWCRNGSINEKPEDYGMSHFIEHMLFKGTKHRSAFEIADEIDRIGGQMNAFTGKEATCFFVKSLNEHFKTSSDVLTDMICNPLFDAKELEREKLVVIEEINMNSDDPDDVAADNLEDIIYKDNEMQHPVLGTKKTVSSFTQERLKDYYYSHYCLDSIAISVAGSFNKDEVIKYFENKFVELKAHSEKKEFSENALNCENRIIHKDVEQAHLAMGLVTEKASNKRRYVLAILNNLFGGGMSSRLFQNVREKKGLAYSVYSLNGFYSNTGVFAICAGIAKDRKDEALDAIWEELDILSSEKIKEREFLSAREQLKSGFIFSQESVQNRMISNGRNFLRLGHPLNQDEELKLIDSITLDDLETTKGLIADKSKYSVVIVTGKDS